MTRYNQHSWLQQGPGEEGEKGKEEGTHNSDIQYTLPVIMQFIFVERYVFVI